MIHQNHGPPRQAGAGPRPSSVVTSAVEAVEVEDVEDVAPEVKAPGAL
jgi:hypothetical protein